MISRPDKSERFAKLSYWQSIYTATNHNHKKVDWNYEDASDSYMGKFGIESMIIRPSIHDSSVPMRARRPSAPQNLGIPIVEKFTDLLFDHNRRPQVTYRDSNDTERETFIRKVAEEIDIFDVFTEIRNMGGASGTAFAYISIENNVPKVNYVESRYCTPVFETSNSSSDDSPELRKVTIQYVYETTEKIEKDGKMTNVKFARWYREEIDKNSYIYFNNPEYKEGKDPEFFETARINHNLNMFPGVWIFNRKRDGMDSFPDYYGAEQLIETVDHVSSQINRAGIYNGDPTMHIASDKPTPDKKVGSFNTIETSSNGKVSLVTISSDSIEALTRILDENIDAIERICKVDLSSFKGLGGRDRVTATEITKMQADMFAQASKLRTKYGKAVSRILCKVIKMCSMLKGRYIEALSRGNSEVLEMDVSDEFVCDFYKDLTYRDIVLVWGRYIDISANELKSIADSISTLINAKLLDRKTATECLSGYLPVHIDSDELYDRVVKEIEQSEDDEDESVEGDEEEPNELPEAK